MDFHHIWNFYEFSNFNCAVSVIILPGKSINISGFS